MTDHTIVRSTRSGAAPLRPAVIAGAVIALALLYVAPALMSDYWLRTFISVVAMSIASLGVSLLFAQLGMVSLAQFGLLGVGGWFALRISHGLGVPFEIALLTGGITAAVVGLIVGLPALRMRGLYLAIITLMMAGAIQVLISAFGFPDGGPGILGKSNGVRMMMARPIVALSDEAYFRYALVVLALCYGLVYAHMRGRPGRAWAMIRRGEVVRSGGRRRYRRLQGLGLRACGLPRRHRGRIARRRRRPARRQRVSGEPVDHAVRAHHRRRRL